MTTSMNSISPQYLERAELWLLITTLVYFLMNGAQLFETFVIVPKWTMNPPESLKMLQGKYAPDLKTFWIVAHSIHEVTFIAAIILCWKLPDTRSLLLILFGVHFAVRVWTILYFAPNIMTFQQTEISNISGEIIDQINRWRTLNYVRVVAFIIVSSGVAFSYYKLYTSDQRTLTKNHDKLMEQRLSVITLGVDDLQAQKEFYKTKLGWNTVAENKDIVFFKLNGFLFSLFGRAPLASLSGVAAGGSGFRALTISYNVGEKKLVDDLYQELKGKGVKILKEPTPTPFGGYYFTFSDLESNVLEVSFNPYIPLDESGDVVTHKNIDKL